MKGRYPIPPKCKLGEVLDTIAAERQWTRKRLAVSLGVSPARISQLRLFARGTISERTAKWMAQTLYDHRIVVAARADREWCKSKAKIKIRRIRIPDGPLL